MGEVLARGGGDVVEARDKSAVEKDDVETGEGSLRDAV